MDRFALTFTRSYSESGKGHSESGKVKRAWYKKGQSDFFPDSYLNACLLVILMVAPTDREMSAATPV